MTQTNETNSRIARLEALILEIATANLRHDTASARHDDEFSRINAILDRNAEQLRETQQNLTASVQDMISMITQLAEDAAEDRKLIIGLQTESRRILERLERHTNDGHGGQ